MSIDVAGAPDERVKTGQQLIHLADLAMYEAMALGRNRIEAARGGRT